MRREHTANSQAQSIRVPILKASALYFALTFAAGWVLGPIREFRIIPRLGRTAGLLLEAPLMLAVSFAAARWVVSRMTALPGPLRIPRAATICRSAARPDAFGGRTLSAARQ